MLRAEGDCAAKKFIEDLRVVLTKSTSDAAELKHNFHKGPLGTGSEAVAFSTSMRGEMEQLRDEFPRLETYSREAPGADDMFAAAFAELKVITNIFDRFETRIEAAYGIPPVVVPVKQEKAVVAVQSSMPGMAVADIKDVPSMHVSKETSEIPVMSRTPCSFGKRPVEAEIDLPLPKTPGLEDFGISNEDLRGLGMTATPQMTEKTMEYSSRDKRKIGNVSDRAGASGMMFDNRDVEELAQVSISDLGIETPVQVAEQNEWRRHRALTKLMVTTTPRLKSGGVERTVDYTELAGGYYGTSAKKSGSSMSTERQLNFDETPIVRDKGRVEAEAVRQRIADGFDGLGFWCNKVSCAALQEAGVLLQRQGARVFDRNELTEILNEGMPGKSCYSIIVSLTKLNVLEMDKERGEEALYRMT